MSLGIIVEGLHDYETYPILIRKIRPDLDDIYRRNCFGLQNLKNKFIGFLKQFQQRRDYAIEKAVVIRDSVCKPSAPLEQQLQGKLAACQLALHFSVIFYATKCKLESWLLADENAINTVSRRRGGPGGVQKIPHALETYNDADKLLSEVLSQAGLRATDKVFAEIAGAADLDRIRHRCPYFREFENRIRDC